MAIEEPADVHSVEFDILARRLYCMMPQKGGQTHLIGPGEFSLAKNVMDAGEKGFSINVMVLKQHALVVAVTNHRDSEITKK